jgi:hypothetical protein
MVDEIQIAEVGPAQFAFADQIAEVVGADALPTAPWHNLAMFRPVTAPAQRFAFIVGVFPRHPTGDVSLMVGL